MNWIKPDWPLPAGIKAAVTLRSGGVSQGAYASLNPATHVNDAQESVATNRRMIREMLNLPAEPVWLQQVHGIRVVKADSCDELEQADASYTDAVGVVCVVLTADCLPVLFCGDQGRVVAAAHAGWRGLQAGIIDETIKKMQCAEISVWLGPAIGAQQFEVGEDVFSAFSRDNPETRQAFQQIGADKWLADIYRLATINLQALGVSQIFGAGFCTVSDVERFYSYRRDGGATGRMASLIWRTET